MSTILKALKRSEARRPRESPLPLGRVPERVTVRRRRWGLSLAATMLVVAAVGAASWMWWPRTPLDPPSGQDSLRRIAEVSLPASRSSTPDRAPTAGSPAPESNSAAGEEMKPEPPPSSEARVKTDGGASANGRHSNPESSAESGGAGKEQGGPGAGNRGPEPEPAGKPESARQELAPYALLPRIENLDPGRRRELPALDLNVHVHAAEPGQRFVMINLSRYREGDRVAPGLTVTAIFPGGVVLQDGQGRFVLPRP